LLNRPPGCPFADRCPKVMARCREIEPPLRELHPHHQAACHLYEEARAS
jgi:oligopeptide/dipeptide ABC transporter ATP-binding protein